MNKTIEQLRDDIQDAENQLEHFRSRYLTACGWEYTCDTPGSYWLWTKTIDGTRYAVSADLALSMQDRS
jgi:hypothetical protein